MTNSFEKKRHKKLRKKRLRNDHFLQLKDDLNDGN